MDDQQSELDTVKKQLELSRSQLEKVRREMRDLHLEQSAQIEKIYEMMRKKEDKNIKNTKQISDIIDSLFEWNVKLIPMNEKIRKIIFGKQDLLKKPLSKKKQSTVRKRDAKSNAKDSVSKLKFKSKSIKNTEEKSPPLELCVRQSSNLWSQKSEVQSSLVIQKKVDVALLETKKPDSFNKLIDDALQHESKVQDSDGSWQVVDIKQEMQASNKSSSKKLSHSLMLSQESESMKMKGELWAICNRVELETNLLNSQSEYESEMLNNKDHSYHSKCLYEYIKERIKPKTYSYKCPVRGCSWRIKHSNVTKVLKNKPEYPRFIYSWYLNYQHDRRSKDCYCCDSCPKFFFYEKNKEHKCTWGKELTSFQKLSTEISEYKCEDDITPELACKYATFQRNLEKQFEACDKCKKTKYPLPQTKRCCQWATDSKKLLAGKQSVSKKVNDKEKSKKSATEKSKPKSELNQGSSQRNLPSYFF